MNDRSFLRLGGLAALGLAATNLLYALLLVLGTDVPGIAGRLERVVQVRGLNQPANLLLGVTGLLGTLAVMAVYERIRDHSGAWGRWAVGVGLAGAVLTAIHGFWDFMRTPVLLQQWDSGNEARRHAIAAFAGVPSPVDPRGLGAFLLMGCFVLVTARFLARSATAVPFVGPIGLALGLLMIVLFLAGLLGPATVRATLAGLTIGIVAPVWWALAGWELVSSAAAEESEGAV